MTEEYGGVYIRFSRDMGTDELCQIKKYAIGFQVRIPSLEVVTLKITENGSCGSIVKPEQLRLLNHYI
jgi:hypothetical protein